MISSYKSIVPDIHRSDLLLMTRHLCRFATGLSRLEIHSMRTQLLLRRLRLNTSRFLNPTRHLPYRAVAAYPAASRLLTRNNPLITGTGLANRPFALKGFSTRMKTAWTPRPSTAAEATTKTKRKPKEKEKSMTSAVRTTTSKRIPKITAKVATIPSPSARHLTNVTMLYES